MKRIFIGIKINPDKNFKKLITAIREELSGEAIKWTDLENIHITLAFLGDTHEDRLEGINEMLREKCEGRGGFEISLKGFGVFKSLHDPKVFWAGLYQSDKLSTLQASIVEGLKGLGITVEGRPFSPHLTIGRIKHIRDFDNLKVLLLKYHSTDIQRINVSEVILYESILRQEGPVYKALEVLKL
ncbi:MAG TPA: RNA 2',3'-cyclic phosphodiesterase [Bacteroidales bacterium]|nr:RNA 2',3'-cyclic phosphodiesterase [Bacteroidales bacterium]